MNLQQPRHHQSEAMYKNHNSYIDANKKLQQNNKNCVKITNRRNTIYILKQKTITRI